jgi:hypothetical protein
VLLQIVADSLAADVQLDHVANVSKGKTAMFSCYVDEITFTTLRQLLGSPRTRHISNSMCLLPFLPDVMCSAGREAETFGCLGNITRGCNGSNKTVLAALVSPSAGSCIFGHAAGTREGTMWSIANYHARVA